MFELFINNGVTNCQRFVPFEKFKYLEIWLTLPIRISVDIKRTLTAKAISCRHKMKFYNTVTCPFLLRNIDGNQKRQNDF